MSQAQIDAIAAARLAKARKIADKARELNVDVWDVRNIDDSGREALCQLALGYQATASKDTWDIVITLLEGKTPK